MTLQEKIKKYKLTEKDWFNHKHYTIITRIGIDKIQAIEKINITYEAIKVEPEFCVVKAIGVKDTLKIETFGSAKYGGKVWVNFDKPNQYGKTGKWEDEGTTTTWYVMEMAEKRAMSRVVLKITGFYELGVFGEDESDDFKKEAIKTPKKTEKPILSNDAYKASLLSNKKDVLNKALGYYNLSAEQLKGITNRISELN